ncbi:hypothetical protein GM415_09640 [Pseudodesulfovibrio cashew]|uniref:Uncharacterized protein n=1 Tax=Pseudodesulfovibrio cashew TaxID=2678688 RepID=A0A6I6JGU2_9BACT|nr:hypothetical protein [Pseudodesulfovibrio cashew]QGY40379.1 hypothetical protein GM415_09640 [Pseudodesulfovibrio cashew]
MYTTEDTLRQVETTPSLDRVLLPPTPRFPRLSPKAPRTIGPEPISTQITKRVFLDVKPENGAISATRGWNVPSPSSGSPNPSHCFVTEIEN